MSHPFILNRSFARFCIVLLLVFLALSLSSTILARDSSIPDGTTGIGAFDATQLEQQGESNGCAVSPAHIDGQNRYVFGGQNRYVFGGQNGDSAGQMPSGEVVTADWILPIWQAVFNGNRPSMILVVDDFGNETSLNPPTSPISHGRWVMQTILDNLKALDEDLSRKQPEFKPQIFVDYINMADPTINYDVSLLAQEIDLKIRAGQEAGVETVVVNMSFALIPCNATELPGGASFNFEEFINTWNQSQRLPDGSTTEIQENGFVCAELQGQTFCPLDEIQQKGDPPPNAYGGFSLYDFFGGNTEALAALLTDPKFESDIELLRLLFEQYGDAYQQWWDSGAKDNPPIHVIPVAASGNYGDLLELQGLPRDPYAPARWDHILATSAFEAFNPDDPTTPWDYAQTGNVQLDGSWLDFTGPILPGSAVIERPLAPPPANLDWSLWPGDGRYRAGTSYASPLLSTALALQATHPSAYLACQEFIFGLPLNELSRTKQSNALIDKGISCPLLADSSGNVDVAVRLVGLPSSAQGGDLFTYQVVVTLEQGNFATGVQVSHLVPAFQGTVAVQSVDRGFYDDVSSTWFIGALLPNEEVMMSVQVNINSNPTLGNSVPVSASVTSNENDVDPGNNQDSANVEMAEPTAVPPATDTPAATNTPIPTNTPTNTSTNTPTDTPIPSPTPIPPITPLFPTSGEKVEGIPGEYPLFMRWQLADYATWYHIQVYRGQTLVFNQWFKGTDVCGVNGLPAVVCQTPVAIPTTLDGAYGWNLEAWGPVVGWVPMTTIFFSVEAGAEHLRPFNGVQTPLPVTSLDWKTHLMVTWYRVILIGPNGYRHDKWYDAQTICNGITNECSLEFRGLKNGAYSWWLGGWGPESKRIPWTGSTFNINAPAPGFIQLVSPVNNDTINTTHTFQWQADPGATWYHIQVYSLPDGTRHQNLWLFAPHVCTNAGCTANITLPPGTFVWRMRSWGPADFGPYNPSPLPRFTVQ